MTRTPEEADAALAGLWDASEEQVTALADAVAMSLDHPAIPMLMRTAAIARVTAAAMSGLHAMVTEDGDHVLMRIHRADLLPIIAESLRDTLVIFDDLVARQKGGALDG